MFRPSLVLCSCVALVLSGCSKPEPAASSEISKATATVPPDSGPEVPIDACSLLTSEEIQAVLGEVVTETTADRQNVEGFMISQCHFALPTIENSFILRVVQRGSGADAKNPREVWEKTFARDLERALKAGKPPEKVPDLGDEAYWLGGPKTGALNVLKGNRHFRLGVGGEPNQAAKIEKATKLARSILGRL